MVVARLYSRTTGGRQNEKNADTHGATFFPNAYSLFRANSLERAGGGELTLTWSAVNPSEAGLQVWYGLSIRQEDYSWLEYKTQSTSFKVTGLTVGVSYSWLIHVYSCTASEASSYTNAQMGLPSCAATTNQGPSGESPATSPTSVQDPPPQDDPPAQDDPPTPIPPAAPVDTSGSITISWPAAKDPEGGKIWYMVHYASGGELTDKLSITISGLESGREYNWDVDSYSCLPGEVVVSGCSLINATDTPHASGIAMSAARAPARAGGDRGSSGGDDSGSDDSGATSASEAPTQPIEPYHDHNVVVTCPAFGMCALHNQALTNSMVGHMDIIEQGILSTTNVWGTVPAGTRVCFIGQTGGGVMFKDSSITPHPIYWLTHYMLGSDTCVDIPGEGTVALVSGGGFSSVSAPQPESPAVSPPVSPPSSPICQIKLETTLYLRAAPNGQRIGLVWMNSEVPVFAVDGHWYQVEFEGQAGFISRYHSRVLSGSC